jgi:hypothetical protein
MQNGLQELAEGWYGLTNQRLGVGYGTALIMKPGEVIETELVAVAYEGEGVKRINANGTVEQ